IGNGPGVGGDYRGVDRTRGKHGIAIGTGERGAFLLVTGSVQTGADPAGRKSFRVAGKSCFRVKVVEEGHGLGTVRENAGRVQVARNGGGEIAGLFAGGGG